PPLEGRANGRPANHRQPPFQCVENVVPTWQTFSGLVDVAMTTMRASVGCIPTRIPDGFSRKSLRTTSETNGLPCAGARLLGAGAVVPAAYCVMPSHPTAAAATAIAVPPRRISRG